MKPKARKLAPVGDPDCLFCKIAAGELPATVVDEDARTLAFMDINPATRGHALVIPRKHSRDLLDVGDEDLAACAAAARRLAARAKERLRADGVNVLNSCGSAAWQTIFPLPPPLIPPLHEDPPKPPPAPRPRAAARKPPPPGPRARPCTVPDGGVRAGARVRPAARRRVGAVRAGGDRGRPHARHGRHSAAGRAGGLRARTRAGDEWPAL